MGDTRRNNEYAEFVRRQFPSLRKVLVVADGKGELSKSLADLGFVVEAVDAKPRFAGLKHPGVRYHGGLFMWDDWKRGNEQLIVAMHPDEATGEVIRYAERHGIPWSVVPCCIKGRDSVGVRGGFHSWMTRLRSLARTQTWETQLPIKGKNLVLSSQRRVHQPPNMQPHLVR